MSKEDDDVWYLVAEEGLPKEGERLHVRVCERYITIFRFKGHLSAIDAICHHAGGPLTLGPVEDIEDLGKRVVLCPWHRFMVSIDDGTKVYQAVEIEHGLPVKKGWKIGKMVQRTHKVMETDKGIYVVGITRMNQFPFLQFNYLFLLFCLCQSLSKDPEPCVSDKDACSHHCAKSYPLYSETTNPSQP
jgi:nitrite reductase/ring-hydroxylating ferredoxin subunit